MSVHWILFLAAVLVVAIIVTACAIFLAGRQARPARPSHRASDGVAEPERELSRIKDELDRVQAQHREEFQQFIQLESRFTERLDKRFLIRSIVEAASRRTSTAQTDSAVSLWSLNFGNDVFDFEEGVSCDQAMFVKSSFRLTDQPFARVVETKQVARFPTVEKTLELIKPEEVTRLGSATSMLVIPLVIENAVLGVLLVFCHPDTLKGYEERTVFYDVTWNQLTVALAIAIQGELAITDRLTGLHNREYFMERLSQELNRSNRYKLTMTLLMLDIDDFKPVNDTLGHLQGDAVLKIISKLLKKGVRAVDLIGRYGGEEFVILLPETGFGKEEGGRPGGVIVAERIRKAVEEEFSGMRKPLGLTLSIGGVVRRFPEDREMDHRALIRLADEQLYRAKAAGKNRVCLQMPAERERDQATSSRTSSPSDET